MLWSSEPIERAAYVARHGGPSRARRAYATGHGVEAPLTPSEVDDARSTLGKRRLKLWASPDAWRKDGLPSVLFVRGALPPPHAEAVAIVGARSTDAYGEAVTCRVSSDAVRLGAAVISGGADGVDGVAHRSALETGGRTWVVLGGGHDHPYPAHHRDLFADAAASGGVVSAYWPTTRPAGFRFIERNKIIAALASTIVVTRARSRSGSASTIRFARSLGRRVLAVPGNVGDGLSSGPNQLLAAGKATALVRPSDLAHALGRPRPTSLEDWPTVHCGDPDPFPLASPATPEKPLDLLVDPTTQSVKDVFPNHSTLDLDAVVMRTGFPATVVVASLALLQMTGDIEHLPGPRYRRR